MRNRSKKAHAANRPDVNGEVGEEEAFKKALNFIRYRPRTTGEVRERLRRWGCRACVTDSVIDRLKACALLDDVKFSRVFMEELLNKGYGYYRVRGKLLEKRLDRGLVEKMMDEYPHDNEVERARTVACRRVSRLIDEDDVARRRKLKNYLTRRGYEGEVAEEACRNALVVDTELKRE